MPTKVTNLGFDKGHLSGITAAADLSSYQYYFVAQNTSGQAALATAQGQRVIGVLEDAPSAEGRNALIAYRGCAKVIAGGAVAINDPICCDSSGRAIKANDSDEFVIGVAMSDASAAGEYVNVLLLHAGALSEAALTQTFVSSANYSSSGQYTAMKAHTTAGQIVQQTSAGAAIIGVLQNAPASAAEAEVISFGPATAKAGAGGVSAGDALAVETATGKLIAAADGDFVVGYALAAIAADANGSVYLVPNFLYSVDGDMIEIASQAQGDLVRYSGSTWERVAAATAGQVVMGDGTDVVSQAISGDIELSSSGVASRARSLYAEIFEDFLGPKVIPDQGSPGDQSLLVTKDTSAAGAPVKLIKADAVDGQFEFKFAANDEEEILTLYSNDELNIDIDKDAKIIWRLKVASATLNANDILVFGAAGAQNDTEDTIAQHAWFRIEGANLDVLLESDDGTNDNNDKDPGVTLTTDTMYEFMIDFADTSDVKFYYRSTLGGSWTEMTDGATTFDMSNYTGNLQLFLQLHKSGGTQQTDVLVDYVQARWLRS